MQLVLRRAAQGTGVERLQRMLAAAGFKLGAIDGSLEHTISLFSLSKAYGFASWRIGWMVIPEHLFEPVRKIQDTNLICPPVISQWAAVGAMTVGKGYCHEKLETTATIRRLFLDRYTDLLELSRSQQYAMRVVLGQYLERVEYDESRLPAEFYPFERSQRNQGQRVILLSPFISFGRPVLKSQGVSTRAVVQRLDAGEAEDIILGDYRITQAELEEAVLFEAAA